MYLHLVIDPLRIWSWQAALADDWRRAGHRVEIVAADESRRRPLPAAYGWLEALESVIARGPPLRHARRLSQSDVVFSDSVTRDDADLIVDASGSPGGVRNRAALTLRFDGGDEADALRAICHGAGIRLTLARSDESIAVEALPAIEQPLALTRALEHVFTRARSLCRAAPRFCTPPRTVAASSAMRGHGESAFVIGAAALTARALAARFEKLARAAPRWRTGHRIVAEDRVIDRRRWPSAGYAMLPDDGARFFADPFPVMRDGVRHVFVEEYPFATRKGVLSRYAIDEKGCASPTKIVLERPYHLSYPMIFERGGETWMIPETSQARRIELYRADPFPDRWVLERTLVDDVIASDMTLLEHGGKLWLLGTLAEEGGSTWDGLCAFFAEDLFGAWRAHPANPLLIDASCARPAGFVVATASGLVRPVQDCRTRYGGALALARIDRLDEEEFSQSVIARLPPDPRWHAIGAHTLNEAGGVETIDCIA